MEKKMETAIMRSIGVLYGSIPSFLVNQRQVIDAEQRKLLQQVASRNRLFMLMHNAESTCCKMPR